MHPNTSKYVIFEGLFAHIYLSLGNIALICSPLINGSQIDENVGQQVLPRFMAFTLKCPSQQCWSSNAPSFFNDCLEWIASISCTFVEFISYKLPLHCPNTIIFPFRPFTKHQNWVNCTFNMFDKTLLPESKLACNLDTWKASLIQIFLILLVTSGSTIMEPIPINSMMLLSPK